MNCSKCRKYAWKHEVEVSIRGEKFTFYLCHLCRRDHYSCIRCMSCKPMMYKCNKCNNHICTSCIKKIPFTFHTCAKCFPSVVFCDILMNVSDSFRKIDHRVLKIIKDYAEIYIDY